MKLLVTICLLALSVGLGKGFYDSSNKDAANSGRNVPNVANAELQGVAKIVAEKDAKVRAARELSARVQKETVKQRVVGDSSREHVISLIYRYFGKNAPVAVAVFRAESGLRCNAVSSTHDSGVAQINIVHAKRFRGNMLDCEENIRVAYEIFKEQGWGPWSAWKNGHYLAFL